VNKLEWVVADLFGGMCTPAIVSFSLPPVHSLWIKPPILQAFIVWHEDLHIAAVLGWFWSTSLSTPLYVIECMIWVLYGP